MAILLLKDAGPGTKGDPVPLTGFPKGAVLFVRVDGGPATIEQSFLRKENDWSVLATLQDGEAVTVGKAIRLRASIPKSRAKGKVGKVRVVVEQEQP